jgi:membrane protease YdiL (CAAX protease family)
VDERRVDSALDLRRLSIYFGVLIPLYAASVAFFWNSPNREPVFLFVMFAPTAGALAARYLGPGVIQWGKPRWWIFAGLLPTAVALAAYAVGAALGLVRADVPVLGGVLLWAPLTIVSACVSATGEEIGWRGFLWPLLRGRRSFLLSSLIVGVVWWLYHLPLILLGWYGSLSGVAAFTVAIAGFTLFVGALTDRSASVWPSVVAHGGWNALVATGFAGFASGGTRVVVFTGSPVWLGEFGWLAAIAMLLLGGCAAVLQVRQSKRVSPPSIPSRPV